MWSYLILSYLTFSLTSYPILSLVSLTVEYN